jgi:hypothetical protein
VADLQMSARALARPCVCRYPARQRLHFVRPGEDGVRLLDPGETPARLVPKSAVAPDRPWFSDLWASVDAADRPQP